MTNGCNASVYEAEDRNELDGRGTFSRTEKQRKNIWILGYNFLQSLRPYLDVKGKGGGCIYSFLPRVCIYVYNEHIIDYQLVAADPSCMLEAPMSSVIWV